MASPSVEAEQNNEDQQAVEEQDDSWQTSVPKRIHKQRLAQRREEGYSSRYKEYTESRPPRALPERRKGFESCERVEGKDEQQSEQTSTDSNEDDRTADPSLKSRIFDKEKFVEAPPPKTNPWAKKIAQESPRSDSPTEGLFITI